MASELGHILCPAEELIAELDAGSHAAVSRVIPTAADEFKNPVRKAVFTFLAKNTKKGIKLTTEAKISTERLVKVKKEPLQTSANRQLKERLKIKDVSKQTVDNWTQTGNDYNCTSTRTAERSTATWSIPLKQGPFDLIDISK